MSNPADPPKTAVSIHVRSELQYDYQAQVTPFEGDPLSTLSMTVARNKERFLNMYYIQGSAIYNAYQNHEDAPTGSPPWSVESMRFESTGATPIMVRALGLVGPALADWVCAVSNRNDVYLLETSKKYPFWQRLPLLDSNTNPNPQILDVSPFLGSDAVPHISVVTKGNKMYILNPESLEYNEWYEDTSLRHWFTSGVLAFASSGSFSLPSNQTSFGYIVAGAQGTSGLTILTGKPYSTTPPAYKYTVDAGTSYSSVQIASMPAFTGSSYPLIFAVDKTFNAYYFQVKDTPAKHPQFQKVPIFSGIKVKELTACFRTDQDPSTWASSSWIEIFALDVSGKIYHAESLADNLVLLQNGHYTVQAWGDHSPLSSDSSAIAGVVSYDGMAYLAEYKQPESGLAVNIYTQDPATTDWKANPVMLPAPLKTEEEPPVTKQHAYYVVATVVDDGGYPIPGRAAVISSPQNAVININGHVKSIDSVHTASTLTNGAGQISFTLVTNDSLSIPIFTLWAEGMDLNHVVDVKPNGPIQARLSNLTLEEARQARDYDAPGNPLLFPPGEYPDATLKEALTAMKQTLTATDPSFAFERNCSLSAIDHASSIRKHLHRKTHPAVARTRLRTAPSMARLSGHSDVGVDITFYPTLCVRTFKAGEGPTVTELDLRSFKSFFGALGDIWNGVKKGFHKVVNTVVEGVKNGVKVIIKFIKDGVEYIWNGLVHLVQMGFHLVDIIFKTLGKAFKTIFGWLGKLIDMDSINRSADKFKTVLLGFPQFAEKFFGTTLTNATRGATAKAKTWLNKAFGEAEALLGRQSVGQYSDLALIPRSGKSAVNLDGMFENYTAGNVLDDLPSTAFWFINKIFNATGGGNSAQIKFSNPLTKFTELWDKLWKELETVDLKADLKQIAKDLSKTFKDFNLRSVFNGSLWVDLLRVVKDILFLIIDLAEGVALAIEVLIAEAIHFFIELLNLPLNIPVISRIFKWLTGHELTIINVVAYLVAFPFTFLYRIITGSKPFENTVALQSSLGPAEILNIAKGTVMLIRTYYLTAINGLQDEVDVFVSGFWGPKTDVFPPFISRIINGVSFCIPIIVFGLAGYPSLLNPTMGSIVGWAAELIPAGLVVFHVIRTGNANTISLPTKFVDWVIFGVGAVKLGVAIYRTITLEPGPGHDALVASTWFTPWPSFAQPLRLLAVEIADPLDAQYIIIAKAVITSVCGLGEAIAFIVANSKTQNAIAWSEEDGDGDETKGTSEVYPLEVTPQQESGTEE